MKKTFFIAAFAALLGMSVIFAQSDGNGSYKIGDIGPAGGLIFYDKGTRSNGWRYLEVAPSGTEFSAEWGAIGKVVTGTRTDVGSGKRNTEIIVIFLQRIGKIDTAAQLCDKLIVNGFDDWFLPSKDELNLMYTNLLIKGKGLGNFQDQWYWSSSEDDREFVFGRWFNPASSANSCNLKYDAEYVRAVRAF